MLRSAGVETECIAVASSHDDAAVDTRATDEMTVPAALIGTPSVYGADSRPSVPAMAASLGVVGLVLSAFLTVGLAQAIRAKPSATLVRLVPERIELPPPPPPPPASAPRPETPITSPSPIVAPAPLVTLPPLPVNVATSPAPVPEIAVPGPPSPPAPSPPAIANGGDLSSQMLSAPPPTYPMESRRRHEQGTVVLSLLLSADGRVEEIGIARSSGSERLDRAALNAVRRWRWSPTMRGGTAVMVRGTVEIPFILNS